MNRTTRPESSLCFGIYFLFYMKHMYHPHAHPSSLLTEPIFCVSFFFSQALPIQQWDPRGWKLQTYSHLWKRQTLWQRRYSTSSNTQYFFRLIVIHHERFLGCNIVCFFSSFFFKVYSDSVCVCVWHKIMCVTRCLYWHFVLKQNIERISIVFLFFSRLCKEVVLQQTHKHHPK